MLAKFGRAIVEAVFPDRCIGCGLRGTLLCEPCRAELPYLPDGVCHRCSARRTARGACRGCPRLSSALSSLRGAFAYEGAARGAVVALKFRSGRHLAPLMGELLREDLQRRPLSADVVVPVPLSPSRLRQRGFNQATLLAHEIAMTTGGTLAPEVLSRNERPAQRTLSAARRLTNLDGAFACTRPEDVRGKRVLLVDDVATTGATVSACADTLAQAGASRILALAFARDL